MDENLTWIPLVLPFAQLQELGRLAKAKGMRTIDPIAGDFLKWGLQAFCKELSHKMQIQEMARSSGLSEIWDSISGKAGYASVKQHTHIFHFSGTCLRSLSCNASHVSDIPLSILVRWFFRLKFDDFCKEKTNASP